MLLNVLKYDLICDGTAGGTKVASGPEMSAPTALPNVGKLLLDLVRGSSLHALHEPAHRNARRDRHEQVDMIVGQHAADDRGYHLATNLANDFTNSLT